MRILIVTDCYFPETNGISFYVEKLAKELAKTEHEVLVWSPSYQEEGKEENLLKIERFASIRVPLDAKTQFVWPVRGKIREKLAMFRPEVIHVHTLGMLGVSTILEARKLKIPVVVTYHTLVGPTLVSYPQLKPVSSVVKKAAEAYTRWVCNKATLVMALSPVVADFLKSTGVKVEQKLVPNGVETKLFTPKSVEKKYDFIFVGRLGFEKGVEVLIEAMDILKKKNVSTNLLVVGSGPAEEMLRKMVEDRSLQKEVSFLGNVVHEQLAEIYIQAKVFISASQFEVNPTVVWEALACGLPVVAAHKGGLAAGWIENGAQGYLLEKVTPNEYASYLEKIISDKKKLKEMSIGARKLAETNSVEEMAKKILAVYQLATKKS